MLNKKSHLGAIIFLASVVGLAALSACSPKKADEPTTSKYSGYWLVDGGASENLYGASDEPVYQERWIVEVTASGEAKVYDGYSSTESYGESRATLSQRLANMRTISLPGTMRATLNSKTYEVLFSARGPGGSSEASGPRYLRESTVQLIFESEQSGSLKQNRVEFKANEIAALSVEENDIYNYDLSRTRLFISRIQNLPDEAIYPMRKITEDEVLASLLCSGVNVLTDAVGRQRCLERVSSIRESETHPVPAFTSTPSDFEYPLITDAETSAEELPAPQQIQGSLSSVVEQLRSRTNVSGFTFVNATVTETSVRARGGQSTVRTLGRGYGRIPQRLELSQRSGYNASNDLEVSLYSGGSVGDDARPMVVYDHFTNHAEAGEGYFVREVSRAIFLNVTCRSLLGIQSRSWLSMNGGDYGSLVLFQDQSQVTLRFSCDMGRGRIRQYELVYGNPVVIR